LPARLLQVALIGLLGIGSIGAADNGVRYNDLGHKMMCVCSCAQVLIECNHVGCPDSESMLGILRTSLDRGDGDRTILEAFEAKYGPTVLAAPMLTRFNAVAWVVPPAVLALGMLGAVVLIRRWKLVHHEKAPVSGYAAYSGQTRVARDRVRDEIRRETEL
jgi:cytochrome c-type biogenesis protein CcmH